MPSTPVHKRAGVRWVAPLLWLTLLGAYIVAGVGAVPFHGDESTQTYMSHDYAYTFQQRDLGKIFYAEEPTSPQEQELRIINGTVNKYTIGLAWHLGGYTVAAVNEQWDWGAPYDYNLQTGHHPADLLPSVRVPSALFTAAGAVVMFAIGWRLGGGTTAYLASLFYALNPAVLVNGRRAMMEGSMLFGGVLVVLAGIVFLSTGRRWAAVALGVAAGFALATKHTNLFPVFAVFVVCALTPIPSPASKGSELNQSSSVRDKVPPPLAGREFKGGVVRHLFQILLAGIITLLVFYALNPAWWRDPIATAAAVLDLRTNLLAVQTEVFGSYSSFAAQTAGYWRQVMVGAPMYYEVPGWDAYIGEQIRRYERLGLAGVRLPGWGVPYALLTVLGGASLLRGDTATRPARWIVGGWALLVSAFTFILTPLEWQRYYLPAVPAACLLAAHGAAVLIHQLLANRATPQPDHDAKPTADAT